LFFGALRYDYLSPIHSGDLAARIERFHLSLLELAELITSVFSLGAPPATKPDGLQEASTFLQILRRSGYRRICLSDL
jgi:hypothetical protein